CAPYGHPAYNPACAPENSRRLQRKQQLLDEASQPRAEANTLMRRAGGPIDLERGSGRRDLDGLTAELAAIQDRLRSAQRRLAETPRSVRRGELSLFVKMTNTT